MFNKRLLGIEGEPSEREIDTFYCYGNVLFYGTVGIPADRDLARRWLLRAAVYDHEKAKKMLLDHYGINTDRINDPEEMFRLSCTLLESEEIEKGDEAFFWICKAKVKGREDTDYNIGKCYDTGVGVEENHKIANEFYIKSINNCNNVRAYYWYGFNLYFGLGVPYADVNKAKELFLKAYKLGFEPAKLFLKDLYGIEQNDKNNTSEDYRYNNPFINNDFENVLIYDKSGISIEFGGLDIIDNNISVLIWTRNITDVKYDITLQRLFLDGVIVAANELVCSISRQNSWKENYILVDDVDLPRDSCFDIEFILEIKDENIKINISKKIICHINKPDNLE